MKPYLKNTFTLVLDKERQISIISEPVGYSVYDPRTGNRTMFYMEENAISCAIAMYIDFDIDDICSVCFEQLNNYYNLLSRYVSILNGYTDINYELESEEKDNETI